MTGMIDSFMATSARQGLDCSNTLEPWQFVPTRDSRLVAIKPGPGRTLNTVTGPIKVFEVFASPPPSAPAEVRQWAAKVQSVEKSNFHLAGARFFVIRGVADGVGSFKVGGRQLRVDVGLPATVAVRLHLISDVGKEFRTWRSRSEAELMLAEANKVLEPQTGFRFIHTGTFDIVGGRPANSGLSSLGAQIKHRYKPDPKDPANELRYGDDETHWITAKGGHEAVNYYFVWNIDSAAQTHNTATPDAVAIQDRHVLVSNRIKLGSQGGAVMAHEFIHNCGYHHHDDDGQSIMSQWNSQAPATQIRRSHRVKMREWYNLPW